MGRQGDSAAATRKPQSDRLPLDQVITTDQLDERSARPADYAAESAALAELMQALTETSDADAPDAPADDDAAIDRVLQQLAETTLTLCRAQSCGVSIVERDGNQEVVRWRAVAGAWAAYLGSVTARSACPCGTALDRDTALLMDDPARHFPFPPVKPAVAEVLLVPFHHAGEPVGTIWAVAHDTTRRFDREDLRLITSLARFAALAYQLLHEHRQRVQRELAAMMRLHELVARLLICPDNRTAMREVLAATIDITGARMGNVQLLDPATNALEIVAQQGFSQQFLDHFRSVGVDAGSACSRVLATGRRVVIEDVLRDPVYAPHRAIAAQAGYRAVQSTPLISRNGDVLGVLSTHYPDTCRPSQRDLRLLDLYARQAADFIERKRAERALRESEKRFHNLADTAPALLWVTDDQHECTFLSRGWFEFTGQSEAEGLGSGWTQAIHSDDRARVTREFLDAAGRRVPFYLDYRLRRADGVYRWVLDAARPRFTDGRVFAGYIGSVIDVHERRQAEEDLRHAHALIEGITQGTEDLIAAEDGDFRFIFFNEAYRREFKELWGRDVEVGSSMLELLAPWPEEQEKARRLWARALRGESFSVTTEFGRTDQEKQIYDLRYNPVYGADGALIGAAHILRNVTDRVRIQDALRRSEERLRAAQNVAGIGTFEWNIRTNVNVWSEELEALYGLPPGGFGGSYEAWTSLVHPDDLEQAMEHVRRSLETGEFECEWRVQLPGGETRWLEARGWVERDERGEPLRMLGVNVDITERKRHEEHLRTVMGELNHRVKNTLATIDAIAQQMLHQADTLESFGEAFRPRLRSMAAAHALLTRSEWSGAELRDILLTELKARVASPEHLVLDGPGVLIKPRAALALHMAIHELATNASKYGALSVPHGRVRVSWSVEDAAGDDQLALEWKELDGPPVSAPPAAGFGNQMVGDVIEYELDGSVERQYESDGLRCFIRFPLAGTGRIIDGTSAEIEPSAATPTASRRRSATRIKPIHPPRAVLVVEDNHTVARTLCRALEAAGCTIVGPAGSLAKANALAADARFDAAILDVDLSGTRVYPLARQLRQRGIPFALLTGFGTEDLAPDLRTSPTFTKPADVDALRTWLANLEPIKTEPRP
ncbi:MAG TPA: PAS domain-containing protein [Phycisphaerae bacterium]|nr:PAS domain-containing protein [Phycisphaerae bacterium]